MTAINCVFAALNAKFIHSSLALRSIREYCGKFGVDVKIAEFTINNDESFIVSEIYKMKPEILGFSCYIWNIEMILNIVSVVKKILPDVKIVLGGPEVSYEYDYLFDRGADVVVVGEGEQTCKEVVEYFMGKKTRLEDIDGIAFYDGRVVSTPKRSPIELDEIPFVYYDCIKELENKIIYYEASRGCPYNCQYCLSSVENGVRFLSRKRVFSDLKFFIDHNVRQVKLVDRTFNCNKKFAVDIWKFIIENDNGVTNFHFEVSADIIDNDMLRILRLARPRLFQLEIGVQSTNDSTLDMIKRKTDLDRLFHKVRIIKEMKNIHQHLDLIAGLPGEDYSSFAKSFNDVYSVYPEQLQLGFLKLLRGSGLRNDALKYGIVYDERAPYEVLFTKDISFQKMTLLKLIAEMVEIYYNSGKCVYTIRFAVPFFDSAFDFFEKLSLYWEDKEYHGISHNKMKLYTVMFEFCAEYINDIRRLKDILKFDMLLNDNVKNFPFWLEQDSYDETKAFSKDFFAKKENVLKYIPHMEEYSPKQLMRMCHVEKFNYDVCGFAVSDFSDIEEKSGFVLFDYYGRGDLLYNAIFYNIGGQK